jgi:hypothetical protein
MFTKTIRKIDKIGKNVVSMYFKNLGIVLKG